MLWSLWIRARCTPKVALFLRRRSPPLVGCRVGSNKVRVPSPVTQGRRYFATRDPSQLRGVCTQRAQTAAAGPRCESGRSASLRLWVALWQNLAAASSAPFFFPVSLSSPLGQSDWRRSAPCFDRAGGTIPRPCPAYQDGLVGQRSSALPLPSTSVNSD